VLRDGEEREDRDDKVIVFYNWLCDSTLISLAFFEVSGPRGTRGKNSGKLNENIKLKYNFARLIGKQF
jgi:hypothetical protein